jgi:hypothetical protein
MGGLFSSANLLLLQANPSSRAPPIDTPARRVFAGVAQTHACCGVPPRRRSGRAGPGFHPTLPVFPRHPPAGPGLLDEVKHDGYGIVACKQGERGTLWTRYGADFIDRLLMIAWRGIVSKRRGGLYPSGTSRNWLRSKNLAFVRMRPHVSPSHLNALCSGAAHIGEWRGFRLRSRAPATPRKSGSRAGQILVEESRRASRFEALPRRTRLEETPQLWNILMAICHLSVHGPSCRSTSLQRQ